MVIQIYLSLALKVILVWTNIFVIGILGPPQKSYDGGEKG